MVYVLDMCDEVKTKLTSDDYGQHLMDVEELIQKHTLLMSDMNIIGEQVHAVNRQAERFTGPDGPDGSGFSVDLTI